MATLTDGEFGEIVVRKVATSRHIRLSVAPDGRLRASMPSIASMSSLKKMIQKSREQIRAMLEEHAPDTIYEDGTRVGKSHTVLVTHGAKTKVSRQKLKLCVTLASGRQIDESDIQALIRKEVRAALRVEAKHYLPRRLAVLADRLDCQYEKVRFSHASSRWGSCSSSGTISLNIALMQLPFELIDYVLMHELSHTKQMNHSAAFWELVAAADSEYLAHRRQLKKFHPTI